MASKTSRDGIVSKLTVGMGEEGYPSADEIRQYVAANRSGFGWLVEGIFEFQTHDQAEKLSTMLAQNTPDPERASLGFWELLSNAVEHGNLEISMDEKTELLLSGKLMEEIERRQELAPYRDRLVTVEFRSGQREVIIRITDQGEGFDHQSVLQMDALPERPNGRGLKLATDIYFDRLSYNSAGNTVEAVMVFGEDTTTGCR